MVSRRARISSASAISTRVEPFPVGPIKRMLHHNRLKIQPDYTDVAYVTCALGSVRLRIASEVLFMIISARAKVRLLAAIAAGLALQGTASADMVYTIDGFLNVGIYYGTAELFSPGGTLLSTTRAITVETTNGCQALGLVDQAVCAAATSNAVVEGLATQLSPAPPPVFSEYLESQLPSFEDINGLGNPAPDSFDSGFDPNTTPTATSEALFTDLTSQPVNFEVTEDTGFVAYGAQFDYGYEFGPLTLPVPYETANNPPCCATTMIAGINVQFFERDLQFTEVATPEPRGLAVTGVLMLLWFSRVKARAA
jgi:hypothetical protein